MPTQLQIGAQNIKIIIDSHPNENDHVAIVKSVKNEIRIYSKYKGDNIALDYMEQSLWHEITHDILNKLGRNDLSNDEHLVQSFSLLLHQAIKTLK